MLTAGLLAGGGRLVVGDGDDRGRRPVLGGLSLGGDGGALWDGVRVQGEAAGRLAEEEEEVLQEEEEEVQPWKR